MSENKTPEQSRRDFLGGSMRMLAFGGLGAYAVAQTVKRQRLANDPNCVKLHTCLSCIEFGGCEKPKADGARVAFPDELK